MNSQTVSDYLSTIKNVALFGASGAIGSEFLKHFINCESIENCHVFSRSDEIIEHGNCKTFHFDYTDESTLLRAKESIDTDIKYDLILITTGMLHKEGIRPEKSLSEYESVKAQEYFLQNTIGPSLVFKHFADRLNRQKPSIMASLCARIGSIEDNKLGGWYSYRAAKRHCV